MNRDYSPAGPPSQYDRYGYPKFNPASMPVAAGRSQERQSVEQLMGSDSSINLRHVPSLESLGDKSVSFKAQGDFFNSLNSRKSLREIQAEKQQQRERELSLYSGIA